MDRLALIHTCHQCPENKSKDGKWHCAKGVGSEYPTLIDYLLSLPKDQFNEIPDECPLPRAKKEE